MSSRRQYVVTETLISVVINTVLSVGFVVALFHGAARILPTGGHGMIVDMAPQTFMVTLMSCLVPGLLTRSRHAGGKLGWHQQTTQAIVAHIWLRALGTALLLACIVVAVSWAVFPHVFADGVSFGALLIGKAIFGMVLAALVTPWAISKVLGPVCGPATLQAHDRS
jgi:hypothetical protein